MRYFSVLIFSAIIIVEMLQGMGIGATAGVVKIYAEPGKKSYSKTLRLINPDNWGKHFVVSITKSAPQKEYLPISNLSWIKVEPETVFIAGKGKSEPIKIVVQIPDSDVYYNRRFVCRVEVSQASLNALSAGLVIPVYIDTKENRKIPDTCGDCGIVVYPHRLAIDGNIDSLTIVNWTSDTVNLTLGWNQPKQDNWKKAMKIFENVMGTFIPIGDTLQLMPKTKRNIFLKPISFPGKGKLYFSDAKNNVDYTELIWGNW